MMSPSPAGRVLLIDDDSMSREVLGVLLASEGYDVCLVQSGEAALNCLRSPDHGVSLILSDIQMPGLSGSQLATALRELAGSPAILIAMSGSEAGADANGFDAFLLKPFVARQFVDAVESCRSGVSGAASPDSIANEAKLSSKPHGASNLTVSPCTQPTSPLAPDCAPSSLGTALDERIFAQLAEAMPGIQLRQMYAICLEDVRKRITEMHRLAAACEAEQFAREAHAVKGGCGMLGASELYRLAEELERSGLPKDGLNGNPGVNPLDELSSACDRLERILGTRT
jgi:CheY-like chemotaxis protein